MQQPHLPSISVVVPAYNEAARITRALTTITQFLNGGGYEWELIVVDDGSTDTTHALVTTLVAAFPDRLRLLGDALNRGKGAAVKAGVLAATKSMVLFTDADQATPIEELPKFITALQSADVAIGSRYQAQSRVVQRQPLSRRILSRAGNFAIRLATGLPFTDTQCGFKAMNRDAARTIFSRLTIDRWGFDIELLVIARAHRLRVVELPVSWHDGGESKLDASHAALTTLRELLVIRRNLTKGRYA